MALGISAVVGAAQGIGGLSKGGGHTHFVIDEADVDAIREIRAVAAARIAEKRAELEQLEAELAVLDEALAEGAGDAA